MIMMEGDEDMFIVIVGDKNEDKFPAPLQIKQEILDESEIVEVIDELLKNADEVNDTTEFEISIVKDEPLESVNSNEDNEFNYCEYEDGDCEDEYIPDYIEESLDDSSDYMSDESEKKVRVRSNGHRTKMLKPSERMSYVKELRKQYPELREDPYLLTKCLVEIMKGTKPPPPPQDYFIMNGIMLECIQCGHHSESIPAASRHYQEKHGERYLICYACGVNFRSTTNLYKHEKRCDSPDAAIVLRARALTLGRKGRSRPYLPDFTDEEPKKFECTECSASFSSKYTLRAHELLHRGERPHRCGLCAAAYTSRTALSRHMKKHGSEQFICDYCSRSFKVKAALVAHLDTHRPQKRFGCSECPKRYSQKAALELHVRREHRRLPPPCACKLCPKRYPRMSLLKEHMKKVHGMLIMTRKMFFKKLPTLSTTQINQAKLVFKDEVDDEKYVMSSFKDTVS
ncbi:myeloid zinc finger 1-like isoform X1 [Vanessa cardui]|uniref:myeloid zinc finger 1-like isoform X1 n=2 Tax=Vanessa cardui TaxID=171605 RepID=UPI001F13C57F|nr:myeloid zinc finger 1-like isoform X1 [Vanessa cardui]